MRTADIAALLLIVGCFIMIGLGIRVEIMTSILLSVTGFLFGKHSDKPPRRRK